MKSIKPGRGPSMMNGFAGIIVSVFGIGWTIVASTMGAPIFFPIYGSYKSHAENRESGESNFCPYCGSRIESDHLYCKNCGRRVK